MVNNSENGLSYWQTKLYCRQKRYTKQNSIQHVKDRIHVIYLEVNYVNFSIRLFFTVERLLCWQNYTNLASRAIWVQAI